MTARYISVADTAKLIRAAIKVAFPGVKFAVRSKSYSGGASISINWTDGPTTKEVEAVTGRFAGATFDGMVDLKTNHDSDLDGERVRFGADYVFCNRDYSPEFLRRRAESVAHRWGGDVAEVKINRWGGTELVCDYQTQERVMQAAYRTRGAF